jgi:hypothetical protein
MTAGERRNVVLWAAALSSLYGLGGYLGVKQLRGYGAETVRSRQSTLKALLAEPNVSLAGSEVVTERKPVDVQVGFTMNRIGDFALKQSTWTANFEISFRWTGSELSPGETFRVVNGVVEQRVKVTSYQSGEERYEQYQVVARMTKSFDASRFPFGDESLIVQVEDEDRGLGELRYVASQRNIGVDDDVVPNNVTLKQTLAGVRARPLRFPEGSPAGLPADGAAQSQFYFAMLVAPDSIGVYLRIFQALFASVAVALIALYIKPTHIDCRFGLPVGGFFASVSNNIFVGSVLTHSDRLTLADMINMVGLVTIFVILAQSAISLYVFDSMKLERLSVIFDRVSFVILLLGYLALNVALPLAARPVV